MDKYKYLFPTLVSKTLTMEDPYALFYAHEPATPIATPSEFSYASYATPVDYYGEVPVFTTDQVDIRDPADFGFPKYIVIASKQPVYQLTYEQELSLTKKRVHRYSRTYRFRWTLFHLIGAMGAPDFLIPEGLLDNLGMAVGTKLTSPRIYELIHKYLKLHKLQRFYLSIPYFIKCLGGPTWDSRVQTRSVKVLNLFDSLHVMFNQRKTVLGRQRFPKMIYVALKLLDEVGITPPYKILGGGVRTLRKRKTLFQLYTDLNA